MHWCERETSIGCLSYALTWTEPTRLVPWQKSNPRPFGLQEDAQPAEPHLPRKSNSYSSFNIIILTLETEWVFKVTSNSLVPGEYRRDSEWCNVLKAASTLLKVLFFEKQRTNFLNSVCITHTFKKNYFYTSFTFFLFILFIHFFLYKENLAALLLFYRTQYARSCNVQYLSIKFGS